MSLKKCFFILGMHRSGTSALTGLLKMLGVDLGDNIMRPRTQNPKGYFENNDIVKTNDAILREFGYRWDDVYPLPENWLRDGSLLKEWKPRMRRILRDLFQEAEAVGIKDPRMCRMFPMWKTVSEEMGIENYCILTLRNPFEVAQSLSRRDGFSEQKSLLMWLVYTLAAEFNSKGQKRVFTSFDELIRNPAEQVQRFRNILKTDFPVEFDTKKHEIAEFLDTGLKHHTSDITHSCWVPDNIIKDLSDCLNRVVATDPPAQEDIDVIDRIRVKHQNTCRFYYHPDIIERSRISVAMGVNENSRTWKAYSRIKSLMRIIV